MAQYNTASLAGTVLDTSDASVPNATGKNVLRGPKFFNADVGLLEKTNITEPDFRPVPRQIIQHLQQREPGDPAGRAAAAR